MKCTHTHTCTCSFHTSAMSAAARINQLTVILLSGEFNSWLDTSVAFSPMPIIHSFIYLVFSSLVVSMLTLVFIILCVYSKFSCYIK